MEFTRNAKRLFLAFFLIAISVLAIYSQTLRFDFIHFDDTDYVFQNPHIRNGLTAEGLKWSFSADLLFDSENADYWQPVTFISRMIDISLFGLQPGGHHMMNAAFHIANACLVFYLFYWMSGGFWRSLLLALFFVLHPVQAETVSWITARKDLLSTFFGLLAIGAYLEYAQTRKSFIPVYVFFILGLLSKPVLAVLPFILILIDRRFLNRRSMADKLPLIAIGAASALMPILGPVKAVSYAPFSTVIYNAVINYGWCLKRFFYPLGLGLLSPPTEMMVVTAKAFPIFLTIAAVTLITYRLRNRFPYLLTGWLWFLIFLLPSSVISTPADRFLYLPLIGLIFMVIWAAADMTGRFTAAKIPVITAGIALLLILGGLSFKQAGYWKDSESIFRHSIKNAENNLMMVNNLGNVLYRKGDFSGAVRQYEIAMKINPESPKPYFNLANIFYEQGKIGDAVSYYQKAIQLDPDYAKAHYNLANVYSQTGKKDLAIRHFKEAIRSNPDFAEAHQNLAADLTDIGKVEEAREHLKAWSESRPK